jgi:hypothetical protein
MERREFLKVSAAASAVAVTTGCATGSKSKLVSLVAASSAGPAGVSPVPVSNEEMRPLLTRMDGTLLAMNDANLLRELTPHALPLPTRDSEHMAKVESLLQKSVRSLYVSGLFLDQPEAVHAHPGLQERVINSLPVMDGAIRESTTVLASLTEADQSEFQRTLRKNPEIGMHVAEALDRRASEVGISMRRRMQLRMAAIEIGSRLRHQHPGVLAEEYLTKTNKAYVRHGESELTRKVSAEVGKQLFWAPAGFKSGQKSTRNLASIDSAPTNEQPLPPFSDWDGVPASKPTMGALRAAGWMFGIGLVTFIGGLIVVATGAFAGVFAMTAGVVLILTAIVVALIGAIIRAAS